MIFTAAIALILLSMAIALARAVRGPTVYDRILAINNAGTMTVLFICLQCYASGRPEFIDLALVYALMNFIGMIAVVRYLRGPGVGVARSRPDQEGA